MSIKISIFFAILHFATIHSQFASLSSRDLRKIQNEIFESIPIHASVLWTQTPSEQNIQFVPLSTEICVNIFQMKYYHESDLYIYFPKEKYLALIYAFANTIDTFQNSTNVKLKINNVVFHNEKNNTQKFLDDVKTFYHSEVYKTSFDPKDNDTVLATIKEWISKKTNGQGQKLDNLITSAKTYIQISLLSFTGCWDKPKTSANYIKGLKFKTSKEEITIDALGASEKIGYYNNSELKYEAIRLPYKNGEFAMAIVMPYQNTQSLELFLNLNHTEKYHQIFDQINEHEENIEYTIPTMNLDSISLNEKGTSVNGDNSIGCDLASPDQQQQSVPNGTTYKQFYVNRPFGLFIYDVKTKFVLVHALVKDPTSNYASLGTVSDKNRTEVIYIQSSNFYEIFHMNLN